MSASKFTRVDKAGSIFYRVTGLIRAGLLKWEDRPLWYDIYACHPPHREPLWEFKEPNRDQPLRPILYKEDRIRAKFYKTFGSPGAISMFNERTKSVSQRFIDQYEAERRRNKTATEDELFVKATNALVQEGLPLRPIKPREFVGIKVSQWRETQLQPDSELPIADFEPEEENETPGKQHT